MKQLIIPIAIGLLAGIGGGTGFAYMQASKQFALDSAHVADSASVHGDSTAADSAKAASHDVASTDSTDHAGTAADSTSHAPALPPTPADSIRALEEARKALKSGGHDIPVTTKLADVKPADAKGEAKVEPKSGPKGEAKADPKAAAPSPTSTAAVAVREARDAALQTALPEQRLAKIFAAMSPKDAAKVLDQLSDTDVRGILGLMGDRQAAAILSAFPAARAAAITRGAMKAPEGKE